MSTVFLQTSTILPMVKRSLRMENPRSAREQDCPPTSLTLTVVRLWIPTTGPVL